MVEVDDPLELEQYVGKSLGVSDWLTVDQAMINAFAETTGDRQWIHIDTERAAREMPGGKTIAHGYLLLSLLPLLNRQVYAVRSRKHALNYGLNKVRFLNQVNAGDRVRLNQSLVSMEPARGGRLLAFSATLEIEGKERPALLAEPMTLVLES